MIEIDAALDESGIIRSLRAQGHAGAGARGSDLVCAAVSVLVRSFLRVTEGRNGIEVRADAKNEGFAAFEARADTDAGRDFLFAAGEFLVEGLRSVAEEFPQNCRIKIKNAKL
ncbi:MAG: ribosomal-processing cysteine protease Prp [Spirochaetaceae bacterium]|jgi:uncharacterized protein YsxB (DUF464 family)|nr:ribosomal-processing cysteine protease Prp [Spirochaetaceae bacterium]